MQEGRTPGRKKWHNGEKKGSKTRFEGQKEENLKGARKKVRNKAKKKLWKGKKKEY